MRLSPGGKPEEAISGQMAANLKLFQDVARNDYLSALFELLAEDADCQRAWMQAVQFVEERDLGMISAERLFLPLELVHSLQRRPTFNALLAEAEGQRRIRLDVLSGVSVEVALGHEPYQAPEVVTTKNTFKSYFMDSTTLGRSRVIALVSSVRSLVGLQRFILACREIQSRQAAGTLPQREVRFEDVLSYIKLGALPEQPAPGAVQQARTEVYVDVFGD